MAEFGRLLKNSRFASLVKPSGGKPGVKPTHQVVQTTGAALFRQEWGLKYSLPHKVDTHYITFNDLDSYYQMIDFERAGGDHLKIDAFKETGLVLESESRGKKNPLFYGSSKQVSKSVPLSKLFGLNGSPQNKKKVLQKVAGLRAEFQKWLVQHYPALVKDRGFHQQQLSAQVHEFLSSYYIPRNLNNIELLKRNSVAKVRSTGGLSYNMKGRLSTSPDGIVDKVVMPGRFTSLELMGPKRIASVGGFNTEVPSRASALQFNKAQEGGKVARETVVPFVFESAVLHNDGSVKIRTNIVSRDKKNTVNPKKSVDYFFGSTASPVETGPSPVAAGSSTEGGAVSPEQQKVLDLLKMLSK